MRKLNWVRGLDRVAIVLAIPAAIWGAKLSKNEYVKSRAVMVCMTQEEQARLAREVYHLNNLFPSVRYFFEHAEANGFIAEGKEELREVSMKHS
ncbi:MAG: hypothetical protein V4492_07150, partial [Chlamydiota bacterium]